MMREIVEAVKQALPSAVARPGGVLHHVLAELRGEDCG
jgi:hypothetical protein